VKPPVRQRRKLSKAELEQRRAAARNKRTVTPAVIAANRANAQLSTGPVTPEGKARSSRNGWKTGLHSGIHKLHFDAGMASLIGAKGKPCVSTCPKFGTCTLVADGLTSPGGDCLDKERFVQAFDAIIEAVQGGEMHGMHGLMASELAAALQMLHDLRATMAEQGLVIGIPMTTSDGDVITRKDGTEVIGKYIPNPGYPLMLKQLEVMGISLPELLVTPQSQAKAKVEKDTSTGIQTALGAIFARAGKPAAGGGRAPIEHEPD
jgi:hypothetical protein